VIRGWGARVDPRAVGRGVLAFTYVAVQRQEAEAGFVAAVAALPEVQECHHVTGEWSYLLKLRLTSIDQLERVLAGAIKVWPVRTHTVIALSSPKESAFVPCDPPDGAPS
jgi:Lrp/AsnC family transcriptional regulator, leucine-responsive regulatory protein